MKATHLNFPTPLAIDALEHAARSDKATSKWVTHLEKFYMKQDANGD